MHKPGLPAFLQIDRNQNGFVIDFSGTTGEVYIKASSIQEADKRSHEELMQARGRVNALEFRIKNLRGENTRLEGELNRKIAGLARIEAATELKEMAHRLAKLGELIFPPLNTDLNAGGSGQYEITREGVGSYGVKFREPATLDPVSAQEDYHPYLRGGNLSGKT